MPRSDKILPMRSRTLVVIGAALSIAAAGCYPDQVIQPNELASVITLVDSQGTPLSTARTFSMPDTVIHVHRSGGEPATGHEGDDQILSRIRFGFTGFGWREITNPLTERPDVVVLTAVIETTQTGVAYGDWWGAWGYWPGWPSGYGAGWEWGYPSAVAFTFESGTVLITMLDLRAGDPATERVPLLWAGGINGVLTKSSLNGALNGISQVFVQSPYLERP